MTHVLEATYGTTFRTEMQFAMEILANSRACFEKGRCPLFLMSLNNSTVPLRICILGGLTHDREPGRWQSHDLQVGLKSLRAGDQNPKEVESTTVPTQLHVCFSIHIEDGKPPPSTSTCFRTSWDGPQQWESVGSHLQSACFFQTLAAQSCQAEQMKSTVHVLEWDLGPWELQTGIWETGDHVHPEVHAAGLLCRWKWRPASGRPSDASPHGASSCVSVSRLPILSLIRTPVTGFTAHPDPGWSHPEVLKLITSAETLCPQDVTITGTGGQDLGLPFWRTPLNPLQLIWDRNICLPLGASQSS